MLEVLKYADRHCLCPSPWENMCKKCQDFEAFKERKAKEIARATSENLVLLDKYRHIVLTPRGYVILQYARGDFDVHTQEED